jgi:hypothetical protein
MRAGQSQTPGITRLKGYTPAFRTRYTVEGDRAHLYFECLWVDKTANKIARIRTPTTSWYAQMAPGAWLIKQMKPAVVPELLSTRYKIKTSGVIQRKKRRAMRKTGFKFVFLRPARSGISQRSPRSA